MIAPGDLQVEVLLAVGAHRDVAARDQREVVVGEPGAQRGDAAVRGELLGEHARLDGRQRFGRRRAAPRGDAPRSAAAPRAGRCSSRSGSGRCRSSDRLDDRRLDQSRAVDAVATCPPGTSCWIAKS